jgi:hypothetical protein
MRKSLYFLPFLIVLAACGAGKNGAGQIAVYGEAELEIEADEIVVSFTLSEYYTEEQQGETNAALFRTRGPSIGVIEEEAVKMLSDNGFSPERVVLQGAAVDTRYYANNIRLAYNTRSYQIVCKTFDEADKLLKLTFPFNTTQLAITELKNSKIEEYRLEVKRMALDNARKRGDVLAGGYGKIRGIIFVREDQTSIRTIQGETGYADTTAAFAKARTADAMPLSQTAGEKPASGISLKKIKLTASVDAVFAVY